MVSEIYGAIPAKYLKAKKQGRIFAPLKPMSELEVKEIEREYPGISDQYLSFILNVGVGETANGMYIYRPYETVELQEHPSFKLYNRPTHKKLFGIWPIKTKDDNLGFCIADSGASWRYCFGSQLGKTVYCFDMAGPTFEEEANDFFTFIDETILTEAQT